MILVDSSVWIDHFRNGNSKLEALLLHMGVACHPFIVGELALGTMRNRAMILDALNNLPHVKYAHDDEVMQFIEQHKLYGQGIGYVDAHLLVAVAITPGALFWTMDRRLSNVAGKLKLHMAE
jgi:predicted nucleic acid-binding protein